ncbi:MAG TPA: amino acid permease [Longimicrobiales bacterium]|nr:amino acid permease [Longimicrobiales bacterium]
MTEPTTTTLLAREERLPRRLGLISATAVLVGSTIGSGIFRVPASIAAEVGTVGSIALLWIVGAMVAVFGALTLAELAALFPRSGGIYVFLREAYGPIPAFLFGWTELLVIRPSALGALAILFAEYTGHFFPQLGTVGERVLAAIAIAVLALTNVRSVDWGAVVANVTTAAKVLALIGVALIVFLFGDIATGALAQPIEWSPTTWGGFGIALISVMWAYDGWADLTFVSGEVRDPERTLPRALIGGVAIIVVVYLLVNLAYLWVLRVDEMAGARLVAADAASRIFGAAGAGVIAALVMLSAFGALNGSTMTGPRILYAMADDGLFFRPIAHVHAKFRTPDAAIILCNLLGIAYVSIRGFERLASDFILGIWPFYALAVGAVFILRSRHPNLKRPYRTLGYPLVPLVFLIASVLMLANSLVRDPRPTLIDFGIILVGIPVYYLWRRSGRTESGALPRA